MAWDAYPKCFALPTPYQSCNVPQYIERTTEDHTHGQLGAVTQMPSLYEVKSDKQTLSFIDCPSVADPKGVQRDDEITTDIAHFLAQVGEFNAICVVLHGSMNRATVEEIYAIEQIKTVIPKNALDRIFIVLTHTIRVSRNVRDFAQSMGLPVDNIFAFDHFALSQEGHIDPVIEEKKAAEIELKWDISTKTFDRLITKAKILGKYYAYDMVIIADIKSRILDKITAAFVKAKSAIQSEIALEETRKTLEKATQEQNSASMDETAAAQVFESSMSEMKYFIENYRAYCAKDIEVQKERSNIYNSRMKSALNYLINKRQDLEEKTRERDELSSVLEDTRSCLDNLTCEKAELQNQIVELYIELIDVSMGSLGFHIGEYYDLCIKNAANDAVKKTNLEMYKQFYGELGELYKCARPHF